MDIISSRTFDFVVLFQLFYAVITTAAFVDVIVWIVAAVETVVAANAVVI